jgi:hypothetical protein
MGLRLVERRPCQSRIPKMSVSAVVDLCRGEKQHESKELPGQVGLPYQTKHHEKLGGSHDCAPTHSTSGDIREPQHCFENGFRKRMLEILRRFIKSFGPVKLGTQSG